mgnify:CR=1 FL=1
MNIEYSLHAMRRMRQRAIIDLEVEYVLTHPQRTGALPDERKEVVGFVNHRFIKVILIEKENHIKIITVI